MNQKIEMFSVVGLNVDTKKSEYVRELIKDCSENSELSLEIKLVPEPDNPYDPAAVSVRVNGKPIGFIAKADQPKLIFPVEERQVIISSWGFGKDQEFVYVELEIS